jgi:hypothetical protein
VTTSSDLRALAVAAVTRTAIVPAGSVFSPRDWPTYAGQYPMILLQTPREEKTSLGRNVPQFTTTVVLKITARVKAAASPADAGAITAEVAVEALKTAIEGALINDFDLTAAIQQFSFVNSVIKVDAEGEYHIGELVQEYGLEIYQGPEDFATPVAISLDEVTLSAAEPAGTVRPAIELPALQS